MPSSTPILGLPYPLGTDPVADGDDAIKALAEKIEALYRPVWVEASRSVDTAALTQSQWTPIVWDVEKLDNTNSLATGTATFTAPVAGFYAWTAQFVWSTGVADGTRSCRLVNASSTVYPNSTHGNAGSGGYSVGYQHAMQMAAGATAILQVMSADNTANNILKAAGSFMRIERILGL